jgi:hypothetical protein|tara:strand:- start:1014 stop:1490 length:477 start_codon:yes stop_codon:yes gene_type:complete
MEIFEDEWPEDEWFDGDLEEELHPVHMTRNEVLFLDDSLTMMLEKEGPQDTITTMRVMMPSAYLPAPVTLIDKLGMAVLRITDPDKTEDVGTTIHLNDTDIYMLREICHSYCKIGREHVGYNLKRKLYLVLYADTYNRDKQVDKLLSTIEEVKQIEKN